MDKQSVVKLLFSHTKGCCNDTSYNEEKPLHSVKEARHKRPLIVGSHLYEMSRIDNSKETESRLVAGKGWGEDLTAEWVWGLL